MNSEGGYLIIGVLNKRYISGLRKFYPNREKQRYLDAFKTDITNVIDTFLDRRCYNYIEIKVITIGRKDVSIVKVMKCDMPIFIKNTYANTEFHVRFGDSSRPFDVDKHITIYKSILFRSNAYCIF